MTAMPVEDPNAEMQRFHEGIGATSTAPPPAESGAPPPLPAEPPQRPWLNEIVDDETVPESLRGRTVGEYIRETSGALSQMNRAGYEKNQALARAQVAEATAELLQRKFAELQGAIQSPAPRQQQPHEVFGLRDPQEIYNEGVLPRVLNQIPQMIDDRVSQVAQQIRDTEVAPLRERTVAIAMETAQTRARQVSGLDEATFLAVRPSLSSILHSNNMNPEKPEAWLYAIDFYRQSAARLLPQQSVVAPGVPPAGNARPGAAAPAGARKAATSGNRHIDAEVRRQVEMWNKQGVKVSAEEIMESLQRDRAYGDAE